MSRLPEEFYDIRKVMEAGAKKHGRNSWRQVSNESMAVRNNFASMSRHLAEYYAGQEEDHETGLDPLLHLATRALMAYARKGSQIVDGEGNPKRQIRDKEGTLRHLLVDMDHYVDDYASERPTSHFNSASIDLAKRKVYPLKPLLSGKPVELFSNRLEKDSYRERRIFEKAEKREHKYRVASLKSGLSEKLLAPWRKIPGVIITHREVSNNIQASNDIQIGDIVEGKDNEGRERTFEVIDFNTQKDGPKSYILQVYGYPEQQFEADREEIRCLYRD